MAFLDPSLEYWQVRNHQQLLEQILNIVLLRRACDGFDGDRPNAAWMRPLTCKVLDVEFAFPTEAELRCFLAKEQELTAGQLLATMKLNYECNDYCSRNMSAAVGCSTKANRFLWSYVLSRCSGRGFTKLAENGLTGRTVLEILGWAWDELADPRELFSNGFAPQKRLRETVKHLAKSDFLVPAVLKAQFDIEIRPKRPRFRNADRTWKNKKAIMVQLKRAHGSGPFTSKHFWRVYNRFRLSQVPDDMTYSECGTGARCFLLLEQGMPQRHAFTLRCQSTCDFFNALLQNFIVRLRALLRKRVKGASCLREEFWWQVLQKELLSAPKAAQFLCCEGVKILRFLVTRSALYVRGQSSSCTRHGDEDEV